MSSRYSYLYTFFGELQKNSAKLTRHAMLQYTKGLASINILKSLTCTSTVCFRVVFSNNFVND